MHARGTRLSIPKLFAIIVALAVLFAPGLSGAAMAAPHGHDARMMEAGHCQAPPSSSGRHDRMDGKSCCISMCMAVAVAPSTPCELAPPGRPTADFDLPKTYRGLHAEIATPPPRFS